MFQHFFVSGCEIRVTLIICFICNFWNYMFICFCKMQNTYFFVCWLRDWNSLNLLVQCWLSYCKFVEFVEYETAIYCVDLLKNIILNYFVNNIPFFFIRKIQKWEIMQNYKNATCHFMEKMLWIAMNYFPRGKLCKKWFPPGKPGVEICKKIFPSGKPGVEII